MTSEKTDDFEKRTRTRRNFITIGSILAGVLLSGCKADRSLNEALEKSTNSKPHRHEPNCYLRRTRILTPEGEKRIEDLKIGDYVCTVAGQVKSVRWIGQRRYTRAPGEPWDDELRPIKIARGALQPDIPCADLFVSQDHRLLLNGVLVRAAELVNESSISLDECMNCQELEYFHVMTDTHSLVLSEAVQSETLLFDPGVIQLFDNYSDFERRYGAPFGKPERPCAPIYRDIGRRDRIRSHLRSALSPWVDRRNKVDKVRDFLTSRKRAATRRNAGI